MLDPSQPIDSLHRDTVLATAGGVLDAATGGVVPGIHLATTFERAADGTYPHDHVYLRSTSPNGEMVESVLTRLEHGAAAMVFGSGMSAALAIVHNLVGPGDHVVIPDALYWALRSAIADWAHAQHATVTSVDMTDLTAVQAAIVPGKTSLVWIETPANPTWEITDIEAVCEMAHRAGARVAVDATVTAGVVSHPLDLGADWVVHAATKFLNGHSDVLAGSVVTRRLDDTWPILGQWRYRLGTVLSPFDAWLTLRGLRTLHLRVERSCTNALAVAEAMAAHPAVASVLYPGLSSHSGHAIAARQMPGGFGGMLSLRVRGGHDAAKAAAGRLHVFTQATSLGGTESLVEHRATVEGPTSTVPLDLLRLSIGIEHPADLIADLAQALTP